MSTNSNYKIMFLRGSNNFPVGCVAFFSSRNSASNSLTINYQVSTLNPSDAFDRRVARQLAIGRLVERPIVISTALHNNSSYNDTVNLIMKDMINRSEIPNRSREAAIKWVNAKPTK